MPVNGSQMQLLRQRNSARFLEGLMLDIYDRLDSGRRNRLFGYMEALENIPNNGNV